MTDREPRRPVVGSRSTSRAPRKLAGRSGTLPVEETGSGEATETVVDTASEPLAPRPGILSNPRTTRALVVAFVLLALVLAVEAWFIFRGAPEPSKAEPVVVPELDVRIATDNAQKQLTEILTFTWRDYDVQVKDALSRMTGGFKKEYSVTAKDTKEKVLAQKAEYSIEVLGSSVVESAPDKAVTLVFLNQIVSLEENGVRGAAKVYPVRVAVTTERVGDKWLVSKLEAH